MCLLYICCPVYVPPTHAWRPTVSYIYDTYTQLTLTDMYCKHTPLRLYMAVSVSLCVVCMCIRVCMWCITACEPTVHVCMLTTITHVKLWVTRWYGVVCICGDGCTTTRITWYTDYRYVFVCIASWHALYVDCLCRLPMSILLCRQNRDYIWSPKAWFVDKRKR